jgi:O-antigen/teichoic acid export membrane protein
MSLAAKIAKNTIYQIAGKGVGMLLGLATVALMTRYLGQKGFGYYTIIVSYLQFFGVLIDFGLQMTTAQLLAKPGADQAKIFGNLLAARLLSAFVFIGLGSLVVWVFPYPLEVKIGVGIAAFSFFFISLQSVLIGLYQKHMAMAEVAMAEVWGRLVLLIGVWLTVTGDWGFYPIIVAISLSSFTNCAVLYFKSQNYVRYRLAWDKKVLKEIWDVSWPLAITISLTLVYFRADTIILSLVRPVEEVGIYGAAYKVLEILVQFPYLFLGLLLPILSESFLINRELFNKVLQKAFDFLAIMVMPMVFGCLVLAEKIMTLVAGEAFAVAGGPLRILILAIMLIYFGALFGYAIVAAGQQKKMIGFYLFDAVFSLAAYLVFIPTFGYWAAAILTVMTELIITVCAFWLIRKSAGFRLQLGALFKAVLASLLMSLVLMSLIGQSVVTLIIIGAMVYFAFLYLLKGYNAEDLKEMAGLKKVTG